MRKLKLFDKVEVDFVLLATIFLLVAVGVIMVYSASAYYALNSSWKDDKHFLYRQGPFAILGVIIMLFVEKIDYHKLKKFTVVIILGTIFLLLAVFAFPSINGAKRWIILGPLNLQPSEIAKYTVVLFMAKSISQMGERIKKFSSVVMYLVVSGFLQD